MAFTATYASFQDGSGFSSYSGGTTAPTQAQVGGPNGRNLVSALLNFTDTDTAFTLTHNMQLTTAQLACLYPLVTILPVSSNQGSASAVTPLWTIVKGSNTITFTKIQQTGSGQTVQIDIRRPGTPGY
jgi:hypothetical protein